MSWIFWLAIVIILSLIEIFTVGLVCIWFVASALVSLLISFFTDNIFITGSVFAILGIVLLIFTRPIVTKLKTTEDAKTNLDRIVGSVAIVTEDITKNCIGEVKVDGKRWSAVSNDKLTKGDTAKVLKIDGVKLVVERED